jgi:ribosomal protein L19E
MRSKIAAVVLAGAVGLTGVALFVPGVASAQEQPGQATGIGERMGALKQALKSLVADGTLNQEQADKVAAAVARERAERPGPGRGHGRGHGPGGKRGADGVKLAPAAVAEALGIEVGELRAEQRAGKTLAQIAEDKAISRETLSERLVSAAESRLAEKVGEGELTQEQADERRAGLAERIGVLIDRTGGGPGGKGPRGRGPVD